jgi:hypothetical protein
LDQQKSEIRQTNNRNNILLFFHVQWSYEAAV